MNTINEKLYSGMTYEEIETAVSANCEKNEVALCLEVVGAFKNMKALGRATVIRQANLVKFVKDTEVGAAVFENCFSHFLTKIDQTRNFNVKSNMYDWAKQTLSLLQIRGKYLQALSYIANQVKVYREFQEYSEKNGGVMSYSGKDLASMIRALKNLQRSDAYNHFMEWYRVLNIDTQCQKLRVEYKDTEKELLDEAIDVLVNSFERMSYKSAFKTQTLLDVADYLDELELQKPELEAEE